MGETKFERFFNKWIAPFCIACGIIGFWIAIWKMQGKLP
jgi:hypothetical protein